MSIMSNVAKKLSKVEIEKNQLDLENVSSKWSTVE